MSGFLDRLPDHARVTTGGHGRRAGYFFAPTVVADLRQDDEIVQHEVFGPVITVQRFDDEDEAVRWANGVRVRPRVVGVDARPRPGDAHGEAPRLRLRVDQHPHPARRRDAHGGFKHSGYGKDLSAYAFDDYTRIKHVMINLES